MENDKERNISDKDNMLNILIELFQKSNSSAIVDKSKCKSVGILSYEDNKEKKMSECFLISAVRDGKVVEMIYDEKGKVLVSRSEKNGMKFELSEKVDLNMETLDATLGLTEERTKQQNSANPSSSDTAKAGEGRDLGSKEHEENKTKEEPKQETNNIEETKVQEPKVKNLSKEGINLIGQPLIKLNQIINGHYFWQLLGLEEKFENKLPDGIDPKAFRTGYLSVVKSSELTAKDGKERKSEDTLVVTTLGKDVVVELDEQVIKPVELRTKKEQVEIEKSRLRFEDGEESRKATSTTNVTRTSMYQIPGISDRFNVAEDYYIGVDWDRDYMQAGGKRPSTGYKQELYFIQTSRNNTYEERQRGDKALEYKLKPDAEPVIGDPAKNAELQEDLQRKDSSEVINERKEHFNELVDRCFKEIKGLDEFYNRNDVLEKALELHNEYGYNDKEIIEAIRENCDIAQDIEHDMPGHNPRRG